LIRNLVGSEWRATPNDAPSLPIFNPATGEVIERVPLSPSLLGCFLSVVGMAHSSGTSTCTARTESTSIHARRWW